MFDISLWNLNFDILHEYGSVEDQCRRPFSPSPVLLMQNFIYCYDFHIASVELKPLGSPPVRNHHELPSTLLGSVPVLLHVVGLDRVMIVVSLVVNHSCNFVLSSFLGSLELLIEIKLMENVILEEFFIIEEHIG